MKVHQQRNPYLKRIYSQTPHKYSFDMNSGKYFLLDEQGGSTPINPNGTFKPKFRPDFSGFADHKSRYQQSANDPSVLHFAPDPQPKTPYQYSMPDKFSGYAQFPYQLKKELPSYLKRPGETPKYYRRKTHSLLINKATESKVQGKEIRKGTTSAILEYSTYTWDKDRDAKHFQSAWTAMSQTKPLPKQRKKSCYNHKCKYMKQWVYDEKGKLENSRLKLPVSNTMGKSFHEGALTQQLQESKLISTMALSGIA